MIPVLIAAAAVGLGGLAWLLWQAYDKNAFLWLPGYLRGDWAGWRERNARGRAETVHVLLCIADHFEPGWERPGPEIEMERVERWVREYPRVAGDFQDADGRPPRHTFFFPAEEYRPELLERLTELVRSAYGEVEVHLHHDDDTAEGLKKKLREFVGRLEKHGLAARDRQTGQPGFAFVHGNWALDNSRPDGLWCGVNNELQVLQECNCFADFTLPSAPSATQTSRVNSIYYAEDDPLLPKSHNDGIEAKQGGGNPNGLMLIQGPLCVGWRGLRFLSRPRIENGNLAAGFPPAPRRMRDWLRAGVCVSGRPDVVFLKLYTHGCQPDNADLLLGKPMREFHEYLHATLGKRGKYRLHYVTAREMFNVAKAIENGFTGDPGNCRDYRILPPECVESNHREQSRTEVCVD